MPRYFIRRVGGGALAFSRVVVAWRTRWRRSIVFPAALYAAVQSFAAVYTGNHYVVDVLIGFGYAAAALLAVSWFWRRMSWPS